MVPLGDFTPDLAPSGDPHLVIAQNVRPIANGYAPIGSFLSVAGDLGAAFVGGGSFIGSDGNSTLLSATPSKLRKYAGAWSDVLSVSTTARWSFAQFGDNIIYANGGQIGSYGLLTGTAAVISTAPTNAIDVATVRDVVMCLTADSQAAWCDINDSSNWTADGTTEADTQPLLDGGVGVRIFGGENALILQKSSIRLVTYTGAQDIWFQFDVLEPSIGCMAAGSAVNVGKTVFFLSERGFEMCDRAEVVPISDEVLNRWFFGQFSRSDIANIWSAADPRRSEVYWAMPGTPGLILLYNWVLKKWSTISASVSALFNGQTSATSIDSLDATYGDLDSIPVSLDDPSLSGGNPILLMVNGSNIVGSLSGAPMQAVIGQQNVELAPGTRARVRSIRPVTDALNVSASVNMKMRAGDPENIVSTSTMRSNGKLPIRANGRYLDPTLTIPAATDWSFIRGAEYEFEAGDGR